MLFRAKWTEHWLGTLYKYTYTRYWLFSLFITLNVSVCLCFLIVNTFFMIFTFTLMSHQTSILFTFLFLSCLFKVQMTWLICTLKRQIFDKPSKSSTALSQTQHENMTDYGSDTWQCTLDIVDLNFWAHIYCFSVLTPDAKKLQRQSF